MPDFIMAAKLDAVPVEYSPKWLKQQQEQQAAPGSGPATSAPSSS